MQFQSRVTNLHRWMLWLLASALILGEATAAESRRAMFRYSPSHEAGLSGASVELAGIAWWFATGGAVRSTPAVADRFVVFGSNDGNLYAAEVKTGREHWKVKLGGDVSSSPAIAGDRVVIMGPDGVLRALRLETGETLWTLATGPVADLGSDPRVYDWWASSPTVVDDTIYVGAGDGTVRAVALATGEQRWSHPTRHRVRSSPAVAGGAVYVGSFDGHVYALDATSGAERWKFQTGDIVQSSPAVSAGRVFFGSRSMAVFALDAQTGALQWRRPHSGSWILASPAVAAGKVIIGGSDSHLLEALDAGTGEPVWSVYTGARMIGSPTVVGDVVVYGGEDCRVYTIDANTGLGRSIDFTEGALYSSVVVADSLLLVGSEDRHLYAFNLKPAAAMADAAPAELMQAATGRYRTQSGDVYTLSIQREQLAVNYCTYPPALAALNADGTFVCPMLWGTTGRLVREPGKPASALELSQFGQKAVAKRLE